VRVQGDVAAAEIAGAVRSFNRKEGFDVLILARGGGSPEDLACFNDERLARAIAASPIPTGSALGHETDSAVAGLVAGLGAPAPPRRPRGSAAGPGPSSLAGRGPAARPPGGPRARASRSPARASAPSPATRA